MRLSVSYLVIKMANDSGYSIHTHYITIDVFLRMIKNDIQKLIRKYGHIKCGLKHKELCDELKSFIYQKKTLELSVMDEKGKTKWNSEWSSKRNEFLNRLYDEEGFINMCFPKTYQNNQRLNKLLSKHIDFCKKKDEWRATIGESREYSVCKQYNKWIIAEEASFTREYLQNIKINDVKTVQKFFSTKKHPEGYNPRTTYHGIKLNCEIYNPNSKKYQHKSVATASPDSPHLPTSPHVGQEFQGKGGKSMPDRVGDIQKNKPDVQILHKTEPSSSDSQTTPLTNKKVGGTPNGQNADSKAKGTGLPSKDQGATGQPTEATDRKAPSPQQLPEPPSLIPPKDSLAANVPDTWPSVNNDQGTVQDSTLSTTSAITGTIHSTENVRSSLTPNLSIDQPQPQPQLPPADPVTANNSKEPTPDIGIKSPDPDTPPTTALNPGLASVPEEASNSSVSGTSSTRVSTTTDSTAGSPPAQDSLLITVPSQSTTTAVSVIGTQPVSSVTGNAITTKESENPKAPIKTISDSQDSISVSSKKQDDSTSQSIGAQSPGSPAYPPVDSPHGSQLPAPPSTDIKLPTLSPGVSPDVSPASHTFVTRPDSSNIKVSHGDAPRQSKGTTIVSSTPLPEVTYPIENPSIKPTEFPSLINIIPTTLILLATLTILFLLYKYTPFGLFLGRRRRKKKDLRTVFEIPEESTYKSPNETIHEWVDHLGREIMENDVYVKLQKINRYKKEMQKKKKKRDTTLIEVHMEILEECKNDEWELHKGDFLEICLQEFINEKNRTEENWRNAELTVNNIKNDKIIQDAEENEKLWNFWMDNYRNILESWKSEEWFQNLKNEWKKERQKNQNKIDEIEENTLKESGMISIEFEKDIWKKWISKQATLI
ncbi:STP1 protein [Plasmodium ovale wallikeri]|nr:STP1 protein [Plasmodium ovale wallikeri]